MADNEFDGLDRLIEDSLDFLPPDDVVDHVSAGKTAFDLIIAGLALSTITLDTLALGYILPLIGVVLLLLGFRRLRGENGCPWDREQTHKTLARYLIEEAYETSQAVNEEDWDHVAEELGDVLLQVFFQADIGAQYGTFELSDVTTAICRKMIARHTHIFGSTHCDTAEEVAQSWERMKQKQRGNNTIASMLADVSSDLPALLRAEKVLKKLQANGLDYQALLADDPALPLLRKVDALRGQSLCAEESVHLALKRLIEAVEKQAK